MGHLHFLLDEMGLDKMACDVACKYGSVTLCIAGNYDYVMPDFPSYSTATVIQL